jgi:hypothetical protein
MIIGAAAKRPMILALALLDRKVVDVGDAQPHQAVRVELSILVTVAAEPVFPTPSTAVCGVARCPPARMGQCQPDQAEARITRQKFSGWNEGSLSASTSALTVPKVVSGLCRIPS